jgi:hypothetical protein
MKFKFLLPSALVAITAGLMPLAPARATVVMTDSVGFIQGTQIFTDSFDITTPGVLTVTLTAIPWLDTLQDLNCFLTSPSAGVLGAAISGTGATFNGTSETMQVQPGEISVNWYGTAAGSFKIGVYGIEVAFQPAAPVPVPASLPLLLSGLGALAVWRRKRRSVLSAG